MGYEQDGSLADLFPGEEFTDRAGRRMSDAVGGHLRGEVSRRTPVAETPRAYGTDAEAWIQDRGGRPPGTARRSWYVDDPEKRGTGRWTVAVDSDDYPVIIWIEHDTKPHLIFPTRAKVLRFPMGATFRYSASVDHPGTTGVHMMRDALADLETSWRRPAELALERLLREEGLV